MAITAALYDSCRLCRVRLPGAERWSLDRASASATGHAGCGRPSLNCGERPSHFVNPPKQRQRPWPCMLTATASARAGDVNQVKKLVIPAGRPSVPVSVTCRWPEGAAPVDIFAYRVHAHGLATAIELFCPRPPSRGG